ncbi:MAG: TadE family protein, partial [Croceibacterium sp.]
MTRKSTLFGNESGASAAEFALVLPVFLMFLVGMIDVGRYTWAFNEAEKATQIGARWAIATDPVPSALSSYSFVIDGGLEQGQPVPIASFAGIHCESSSAQVSCN